MTRHELASFALRLLGIYALIESLPIFQLIVGLAWTLQSSRERSTVDSWSVVIMLVPLLLVAAAGVLLIVFSRNLAPLLIGEDKPLDVSAAMTGREVQAIGFSIVAVLIFLRAIPEISRAVSAYYYAVSQGFTGPGRDWRFQDTWRYGIPGVIQLVLAVILFFQARGLANLWHRLRAGGMDAPDAPSDQDRP